GRRADDVARAVLTYECTLDVVVLVHRGLFRRGDRAELLATEAEPAEVECACLELRFVVCRCADDRHGEDGVRLRELLGGLEPLPVRPERGRRRCGTEVACECIAHPERPREARAGTTGAENPDRRERHVRGHRADAMERM